MFRCYTGVVIIVDTNYINACESIVFQQYFVTYIINDEQAHNKITHKKVVRDCYWLDPINNHNNK